MSHGRQITATFPDDSLFLEHDTRKKRWAVPYHYEALNARVENLIINNSEIVRDKTVLDLGCHFGTFSYAALIHGARSVTGVDTESSLIKTAAELFRHYRIPEAKYSFHAEDVLSFLSRQKDGSYDTIFCLGLLYYINDPFNLLDQMKRVARGHILIDTFTAFYAPCMLKEGPGILEQTKDETFELPVMFYPFTRSDKNDYIITRSMPNKKGMPISMLALPTIPALENFFNILHLKHREILWDDYAPGRYAWKDYISNEVKAKAHWADVYSSKIRVSYLLEK
jgi:SAM-dependent methyltransferase